MTSNFIEKINTEKLRDALWAALLFCVLLFVDQITKAWADAYFSAQPHGSSITVIPDWVYLCITYHKGISYGLGKNAPEWIKIAVIVGTGVMMLALSVVYFKLDKSRDVIRIAIVFVVAGGVGNLIDRVYYQVWDPNAVYGVRDMVDLNSIGFAVCNFADFFISGGAVALVSAFLFFDKDAIFPLGKYKEMAEDALEAQENGTENESDSNARLPKIE